jgi:hypothetical protein
MGEMKNSYRVLVGEIKGRDHLEDTEVDGSMIFKWSLKKSA